MVLGVAPVSAAPGDPVSEAREQVASARARTDEAAQGYFEALARSRSLEAEISGAEALLADLEAHAAELRERAARRAVEAYKGEGGGYVVVVDASDPLESARREKLLDSANADDLRAVEELAVLRDELEGTRGRLVAARDEQVRVAEARRSEEEALEELVAEAEGRWRDLEAARAEQEEQVRAAPVVAAVPVPTTGAPSTTGGPASTAPAAPDPAPDVPAPADPGVHPRHDDPFLVCTRAHESGGNYAVVNRAGPYYGAYQFLQTTWNATAVHAGRPELVGVVPSQASPYDQDDLAWALYQWQGNRPWGGRC